MSFIRRSKWTYSTGAGGGAGFAFVMATGGDILLADPAGQPQNFYYGGVGVGFSWPAKLPRMKLPKFTVPEIRLPNVGGRSVAAAGSTFDFPSFGDIFMTNAFHGKELTRSDLQGAIVYIDASASLVYGWAGDLMLLGINTPMFVLGLSSPAFSFLMEEAVANAPAVLFMRGQTVGIQAGASLGLLAGYMH
jgi:hypothetical protein